MGTNYYLHEYVCPLCGRGSDALHIGKSSCGWCFALHVIPEEGLNSLEDWRTRWQKGVIKNEYGDVVAPEEMLETITDREFPRGHRMSASEMAENHAVPGPNGLLRDRIGPHCVGHGEGTWDLVPGEFS